MNNNQFNFDPVTGQPIQNAVNTQTQQQINLNYQSTPNYNTQQEQKKNPIKKIFLFIVGFVIFFIALGGIVFFVISSSSKKLVCKSNEGNITIMYTENQITGYTSKGISYDLDKQKQIAQQIGVEEYLVQFESWFTSNTTGTCERK